MKRAAIRLSDRDIIRRGTLKAGSGASVPVPRSPHGVNRGILALPKVPLTNAPFGGPISAMPVTVTCRSARPAALSTRQSP